jgi:hypothetical protein
MWQFWIASATICVGTILTWWFGAYIGPISQSVGLSFEGVGLKMASEQQCDLTLGMVADTPATLK